ncbi:MAG: DNA/RNA nuclease SfsA [Deferribacteres bacterium]|nr:DNA/RNA nuclease SfsA [candidate division KSB1 bacterium]MCB9503000.1 DNA/RNA nuclease SfsA [Deferribacteres bacterium]
MHFDPPLKKGRLIRRYNRFLADIELENGTIVIAHCPNSGRMTGCAMPNSTVYIAPALNTNRKLKYTWELTFLHKNNWVGVNTLRTNRIVEEALLMRRIPELAEYSSLQREVKYGEKSRIDFLLTTDRDAKIFVEVKNVSLVENGIARFPDAVTTRGQKHLKELMNMVGMGHRAVLFFLVNRQDAHSFAAAELIDPVYAQLFGKAIKSGVEILVYQTKADNHNITVGKSLPLNI